MGMIFGPIYIIGIWFYYIFYKAMRAKSFGILSSLLFTFIATLPFTYDIVITHTLSLYYCHISSPQPKTQILKKVEYPESIYWEDNVYRGFDREDRKLMIQNYLDGIHLKTMALNSPDGKIYVYRADEYSWDKYKELDIKIKNNLKNMSKIRSKNSNLIAENKELSKQKWTTSLTSILETEKIYNKETMPKMNYTVISNEVKLNSFERKFFYADETKVIENQTDKVIAYNQRYMRFYYNIFPDLVLGNIYYSSKICGNSASSFENLALLTKGIFNGVKKHQSGLNNYLYYTKGAK